LSLKPHHSPLPKKKNRHGPRTDLLFPTQVCLGRRIFAKGRTLIEGRKKKTTGRIRKKEWEKKKVSHHQSSPTPGVSRGETSSEGRAVGPREKGGKVGDCKTKKTDANL